MKENQTDKTVMVVGRNSMKVIYSRPSFKINGFLFNTTATATMRKKSEFF